MTGICGWHASALTRTQTDNLVSRMANRLPMPGEAKHFIADTGGLCARLSKADIASDLSSGLAAVIDGKPRWHDKRLAEIAAERGASFALLVAYQKYGKNLLKRLTGTFALAVQDDRASELLLAIDRMGVNPLCYALSEDGGLVFGSTTDVLLEHSGISNEISLQSIYNYMYFHVVPSPSSIYVGIGKLEPGQLLIYRNSSILKEHYWKPEFTNGDVLRIRDLQDELTGCLRSAVAHCEPDGETGCFLSGGLDSSTVSGLANEYVQEPIRVYSIGFEQQGYDEMKYARIAANHFKLDLREYYVTPDDVADAMHVIATAYDEPFGNSSAIPALFCARRAEADGVRCLLAGDGGDELFAGNDRYARQQVFEHYSKLPRWLRTGVIEPMAFNLPTDWSTPTHKLRRYVEQARVPMPERMQTYNFLHLTPSQSIFDAGFLDKIDARIPIVDMDRWYARDPSANLVDRMLLLDWKLTLADNDLRKVNRMCAVAGVEVAYPLLDDELVAISTRIPGHLKLKGGRLRHFFKESVSDYLPAQILAKQKHGFGLPFGEWLRTSDRLQDIVTKNLKQLKNRGIFKNEFIDNLLRSHRTEHAAYYGNIIWVLVMLEIWLQAHSSATMRRH